MSSILPQVALPVLSRRTKCKDSRSQRAFSWKIDCVNLANTKDLQKDFTHGVVLKMIKIRIKNHTAVVVMTKLPNR